MKTKCLLCQKSLKTIADRRKNGVANHQDWDGRTHHKKCFDITYSMIKLLKQIEPHLTEEELETKALTFARLNKKV